MPRYAAASACSSGSQRGHTGVAGLALILWFVVLAAVTVGAQAFGSNYRNDFSLPGTESQQALDTLRQRAPTRAGDTVQIVVRPWRRRECAAHPATGRGNARGGGGATASCRCAEPVRRFDIDLTGRHHRLRHSHP